MQELYCGKDILPIFICITEIAKITSHEQREKGGEKKHMTTPSCLTLFLEIRLRSSFNKLIKPQHGRVQHTTTTSPNTHGNTRVPTVHTQTLRSLHDKV
jgi:hypothetical protein